jgi:hypothetical protein
MKKRRPFRRAVDFCLITAITCALIGLAIDFGRQPQKIPLHQELIIIEPDNGEYKEYLEGRGFHCYRIASTYHCEKWEAAR